MTTLCERFALTPLFCRWNQSDGLKNPVQREQLSRSFMKVTLMSVMPCSTVTGSDSPSSPLCIKCTYTVHHMYPDSHTQALQAKKGGAVLTFHFTPSLVWLAWEKVCNSYYSNPQIRDLRWCFHVFQCLDWMELTDAISGQIKTIFRRGPDYIIRVKHHISSSSAP